MESDIFVIPDKRFESNKLISTVPLAICNRDLIMTTITNQHDSGITIYKNQYIATWEDMLQQAEVSAPSNPEKQQTHSSRRKKAC